MIIITVATWLKQSTIDHTMEVAFEGVSGLVGFPRALDSITTALSTGAAFHG